MNPELKAIEDFTTNIKKWNTHGNRTKLCGHRPNCYVLGMQKDFFGNYRLGKFMYDTEIGLPLYTLLCAYMNKHHPQFKWNSVIINKNNKFDIHKDKFNKPETQSLTISWGKFRGGRLELYDDNKKLVDKINTRYKHLICDCSTTYHAVEDFKGDRYSAVFYTI